MPLRLLALAAIGLAGAVVHAEVPPPAETPARVIVSGPTSTAVEIKVVKVGKEIPKTYAGAKIRNSPGFDFYVSQHYALKCSRGDDFARMILEVAELAYPHWVALVGAAPPDPETRMYFVCATDGQQMIQAMKSDVGMGTAGGYGGGITIYENNSAYNYQSGTLAYHQRALVIHENLHMLQMIVHGTGGSEDFTYSSEQHVYDPVKKQLTVMCFDKAPINNWTDAGLTELRKNFVPFPKAADTLWAAGSGPGTVYQQFLWRDPDRWLKWRIWRDEYYAGRLDREPNSRVMEDIYGPLEKLNADWERWVKKQRHSFHYVDWGWEQDGNALWAYGWPHDGRYWSQTDLKYAPREKLEDDPLRMDYPAEPMPAIVGPVKMGVAEPAVGYLMQFSRGLGCWGGFGLGVEGRSLCQVVLLQGRSLVIDGKDFGIARQEVPFSEELKQAAKADGLRYGVTVRIGRKELAVTVRAGQPGAMKEIAATAPINEAQRERLMSREMAIIGKDGYPVITPFIDDQRKPSTDMGTPAAANFWRFAGMERLATLYKAAWRLKAAAPPALLALQAQMLAAVDKDPATQAKAVAAYEERILAVVQEVRQCSAEPQRRALALADLTGTAIFESVGAGDAPDRVAVRHQLIARLEGPVQCVIKYAPPTAATGEAPPPQSATLTPFQPKTVVANLRLPTLRQPVTLASTVELRWRGQQISVPLTRVVANTSVPSWTILGPLANPGGATADLQHPIETTDAGLAKKYPGQDGEIGWRKVERPADLPVLAEFVVDFARLFGPRENAAAYALTWIDSDRDRDAVLALGSDDGAMVWLNDKLVHKNLMARGYGSQADRIPVRLQRGRNKVLVKVTQGNGAWQFALHVL